MGQRPLLCPLHGARCDATPARTCITMSRYEAQYGTGGLIPASTLTLIIPESSSDLYEDLLSLPPSVPSARNGFGVFKKIPLPSSIDQCSHRTCVLRHLSSRFDG